MRRHESPEARDERHAREDQRLAAALGRVAKHGTDAQLIDALILALCVGVDPREE